VTGPSRHGGDDDTTAHSLVPLQRSGFADEVGGGPTSAGGARVAAARAARATASGTRGRGVYPLLAVMTVVAAIVLTVTVGRDYRPLSSTSEFFLRNDFNRFF
jgi:poly(beta-D-mannuronate) C5 epimerase